MVYIKNNATVDLDFLTSFAPSKNPNKNKMMKDYIFTKRFIKQFAFAFLLMITMAIKAQNPVNISVATIDQATANTIQGHLNNGTDVIVTSSGAITVLNGVTILKSLGGDASLTLKANFRVTMDVNTSIKSTVR